MMKFLRQERTCWIVNLIGNVLFFLVSAAYQISVEIPVYTCVLMQACMLILELFRYRRYRERKELLEAACKNAAVCMSELPKPEGYLEELYRTLAEILNKHCVDLIQENRECIERSDKYYTQWSHQIKTPIAGMKLLLEEEEIDRAALRRELLRTEQYVETALQYQRLHGVTNDLLIKSYPVEEMVRQALKRTSTLFLHKKVSVNLWNLAGTVITDEKWFVFVLEQLISNAAKYTRNGQISVYMPEGIRKLLIIEDTGIGIRREDLPRIFEWGYTGENGRIDKKATGIGLALCKETLKMIGHGISVESEPGKGTKITLDLTQ